MCKNAVMVLPQVFGLNEITGTVKKNCSIVGEGHKWFRMARKKRNRIKKR